MTPALAFAIALELFRILPRLLMSAHQRTIEARAPSSPGGDKITPIEQAEIAAGVVADLGPALLEGLGRLT